MSAHADYDSNGNWFCGNRISELEKSDYADGVNKLNGVYGPGVTPETVSNLQLQGQGGLLLNEIGQHAHCLKQLQPGIDLNSIIAYSSIVQYKPEVWAGLQYAAEHNRANLISQAPEFAKYVLNIDVPIPEFSSLAGMIIAISIIGVIVISRRFNLRF